MLILLFALLVSLVGGVCLWVARNPRFEALDADSDIPDTVPAMWVDAYWGDRGA
jgi:hypothetical protein